MHNDNVSPTQNQAQLTNADEIVTSGIDWRTLDTSDVDGLRKLDYIITVRRGVYEAALPYSMNEHYAVWLLDNTRPRWTIDIDYSAPANKRYNVSTFYKGEWRVGVAETLALAICYAYLEYTDAQQDAASGKAVQE